MEGLSRPAGSGVPIQLMGQDLILEGLTLKDIGVVENELRMQRGAPLSIIEPYMQSDKIPIQLRERLLQRAYDDAWRQDSISIEEVVQYVSTPDGFPLAIWVALEKKYQGRFKRQEVKDAVQSLDMLALDKLARAMQVASGWDQAGNSPGLASPEETTTQEEPSTPPGPESSTS